ncbi:MAG: methyltransferase domain-containing protein [Rhodobiaceae bacterium]|nr:methyltransferase domain-containing protein [Rhodobiaceae bacterium]
MYLDIVELRDFYHDPLGTVARRLIGQRVRSFWPVTSGMCVVGLGYAAPYLDVYAAEAQRALALMPAAQGVVPWPAKGPFRSALVEEFDLPLPDASVDRLLMVHMLEMSEAPHHLLREAWRVLEPGGKLIVVVPNRRGMWARLDTTPFGYGRPFSRGQLVKLFSDAMFQPEGWASALAMPPLRRRVLIRYAAALERFGRLAMPGFEGVLVAEASKRVLAPIKLAPARRLGARLRPALSPPATGASRASNG